MQISTWTLPSWVVAASLISFGNAAMMDDSTCVPSTFTFPEILGAKLVDVSANEVYNYSTSSILPGTDVPAKAPIDFCNATITYTHPGWNDTINVSLWLPLAG